MAKIKHIEISVFKWIHCKETWFVIEKDGELIGKKKDIKQIADLINHNNYLQKKGIRLQINCIPDCEISKPYGKNPIRNKKLSEEEQEQLFDFLHN
jgi:hypothetical protein